MNNWHGIGRLTKDIEIRKTTNGTSVTSFTLAVPRRYVKQGEERKTDFIDCVAFKSTADFLGRYFSKGKQLAVDGNIQTRTYADKEGKNRKAVEVLVDSVYFTESKQAALDINPEGAAAASDDADEFKEVEEDGDLPF